MNNNQCESGKEAMIPHTQADNGPLVPAAGELVQPEISTGCTALLLSDPTAPLVRGRDMVVRKVGVDRSIILRESLHMEKAPGRSRIIFLRNESRAIIYTR